jgi:2-dehydro-3-deoxyphosphooctonate aldolase (KDO 8-P synthase)
MPKNFIIAGPCIIENEETTFLIAEKLDKLAKSQNIEIIFKASYKKDNRTSVNSFSGIGDDVAIEILRNVKKKFGFKITTDVHSPEEVAKVADFIDVIQIPAFMCRQTSLILAAAETNKIVNVKKGQWLDPESTKHIIEKVRTKSNNEVWLTERGSYFGYNRLIVDFTSIPVMKKYADKVIMDCTHSVQVPTTNNQTGGNPEFISLMAKNGLISGADGLFFEVHPNPKESKSDANTIFDLAKFPELVNDVFALAVFLQEK